jgi:hypothetical protein
VGRLRLHERGAVRALWRGHFEAWRAERTDAARILRAPWPIAEEPRKLAWPTEARRCGGPRCALGQASTAETLWLALWLPLWPTKLRTGVPAVVTRTGRRRQFSEEDKRRIVEETCQPGQSALSN